MKSILDPRHYTIPDYRQRMTAKQWSTCLINEMDKIVYKSKLVSLKAKEIGFGVVEVRKNLETENERVEV